MNALITAMEAASLPPGASAAYNANPLYEKASAHAGALATGRG